MTATLPTGEAPPGVAPGPSVGSALRWSYLLSLGRFVIGGTLTFVLAAILDPRSIGVMFMAMVWISLLLMLIHNASLPLLQQEGLGDEHFSAAFWFFLATSLVAGLALVLAGPALAALNDTPELTWVIGALAPLVVLEAVTVVPDALLRRRLQFRSLAMRSLIAVIVGGLVGVGLAVAGHGVWALIGQQLANAGAYIVTLFIQRPWTPRRGPIVAPLRQMRATAAKSVAGFFGWFIAKRTDALIMGVLLGPIAVGLYRLATRLTEMVVDLTSSALNQVSLPDLAAHHREPEQFAVRLRLYVHANAVLAFPLLGIVAAVATPLLAVLGPEWTDAADATRVLCAASAAGILSVLLGTALLSAQRPGAEALTNWAQAGLGSAMIAGAAYLTHGSATPSRILAVAVAVLITETMLVAVLWHVLFHRVLRTSGRRVLAAVLPAASAGIAADAAGWAALRALGDRLPVLAEVILAGLAGAVTAFALLLATDHTARQYARRLRDRLRDRLLSRHGPDRERLPRPRGGPAGQPAAVPHEATQQEQS